MEKEDWSFETLKKKAIEAMDKKYEDYFLRSHEMIQRAMERRRKERSNT